MGLMVYSLLWRDTIRRGEEKQCKQKLSVGLRRLQMFVHREHIEDKECDYPESEKLHIQTAMEHVVS